MDLMTGRAKVSGLVPDERCQKRPAVRLRVHMYEEVVQRLHQFVRTRSEFRQRWIFENEIALSHRAFHCDDRVTHHATQSSVRLRLVDESANRVFEHPTEEQRRIM